MKPALQFLVLAILDAKKIFDNYIIRAENEKVGRTDIRNWCKNKEEPEIKVMSI